jgi:serine/threonine-protein kinase
VSFSIREGEVLAGKYRLMHILAEGGMGVVVAAQHLKLEQRVALKFMLPAVARSPDAVARFLREARAAAQLQSEHVAHILDVCETDAGLPYMVMEYLQGSDLGALIQSPMPLPVEDAVDYILQACEALAEAHALGIIHRDLKPENLFLTHRRGGQAWIKVLDFGISKVLGDARREGVKITTWSVMGSPAYMSPEQMESTSDVDARTDIWSLGVLLYELLTRKQPFQGNSIAEICLKVTKQRPTSLSDLVPNLPPGLSLVVDRCLAKDRDERYASVPELVRALAPYAPARPHSALSSMATFEATLPKVADRASPPPTARTRGPRTPTLQGKGYRGSLLLFAGVLLIAAFSLGPIVGTTAPAKAPATSSRPQAVMPESEPPTPKPAASPPAAEATAMSALGSATPKPAAYPPAEGSAAVSPVPARDPLARASSQSSKSGAPIRSVPASKGERVTDRDPLQAQGSKSAPASEAPRSTDEDVFSIRK